jgi:hypothetical protein
MRTETVALLILTIKLVSTQGGMRTLIHPKGAMSVRKLPPSWRRRFWNLPLTLRRNSGRGNILSLRSRSLYLLPMRLLVLRKIPSHDQCLKKMQTTAYEAAGPLIHLLICLEKEEEIDTDRVKEALKLSLSLLGNSFAWFSQERRKILVGINSQLGHMVDEDYESSNVLLGEGAYWQNYTGPAYLCGCA